MIKFNRILIPMLAILMTVSNLNAQCLMDGPDGYECAPCGSCGIAYEDSVDTAKLLAALLVGSAVVALIAVAIVNTPCHHGHHRCCHGSRHHHNCH